MEPAKLRLEEAKLSKAKEDAKANQGSKNSSAYRRKTSQDASTN